MIPVRSDPHCSKNCVRTAAILNNIQFKIDVKEGRRKTESQRNKINCLRAES